MGNRKQLMSHEFNGRGEIFNGGTQFYFVSQLDYSDSRHFNLHAISLSILFIFCLLGMLPYVSSFLNVEVAINPFPQIMKPAAKKVIEYEIYIFKH